MRLFWCLLVLKVYKCGSAESEIFTHYNACDFVYLNKPLGREVDQRRHAAPIYSTSGR